MSSTPQANAERGEAIYKDRYQAEYEQKYQGQFVAIDVLTERAFVAETAEGALEAAREQAPEGRFHLIRVGSPGVYRVGYTRGSRDGDWIFGE